MKIGLLAYHSACNFGATLQLLSTYCYLKNNGHQPIVINWVPEDLEAYYRMPTPNEQFQMQLHFRASEWSETELCRTSEDVAHSIELYGIEAVVIGSDAVAQHHSLRERIVFPTKRLFTILDITSDRIYPNPFWGEFRKYIKKNIPVAFLSASSQDSIYQYYSKKVKEQMKLSLLEFKHISVRDTWTQYMIMYLTDRERIPEVTPDPVFAFNLNCKDLVPSKDYIQKKFSLPEKYYLLTFEKSSGITQRWLDEFIRKSAKKGVVCVSLPFSIKPSIGEFYYNIGYPLTPLEWYALIIYSCGYIGNNMHPIVVSLHNAIPFYSFDNYGRTKLRGYISSDKSSKIKHILNISGFDSNRVSCLRKGYKLPEVDKVIKLLTNFDKNKAASFSEQYLSKYITNMDIIIKSLTDERNG